jgi:hypothetical protein
MDFTPEDMEAVQTCLEGIDGNVPVTVEPAAAALLMPNTVRSVAISLVCRHGPPRSSGSWWNGGSRTSRYG